MSHYAYLIVKLSSGRLVKLWTGKDVLSEEEAKELFDMWVAEDRTTGVVKYDPEISRQSHTGNDAVEGFAWFRPEDAVAPWREKGLTHG